jgi:hypothetical protein
MAITSNLTFAPTHSNKAVGAFIDTGTVKKSAVHLGFVPRYVALINATDRIKLEWFEGMAADAALKTIADGTVTLEVSAGITVGTLDTGAVDTWTVYNQGEAGDTDNSSLNTVGQKVIGFNVPAAAVPTSKQFYFTAFD